MSDIPVVRSYLDSLSSLIKKWGVSASYAKVACENVEMQINSLLSHWNDIEFRNALLFIGKEEGEHYTPRSPINPFVVVTIRNSMLENMHSVGYLQTGLKKGISSVEIKRLTQQAIRHVSDADFADLSNMVNIPKEADCYGFLPEKYPLAWEALLHLSNGEDAIASYQPVVQTANPQYRASGGKHGQIRITA